MKDKQSVFVFPQAFLPYPSLFFPVRLSLENVVHKIEAIFSPSPEAYEIFVYKTSHLPS